MLENSSMLTVFPDPVCAQAIRSRPLMMIGIAHFCTGVGLSYFAFLTFSLKQSSMSASSKLITNKNITPQSGLFVQYAREKTF